MQQVTMLFGWFLARVDSKHTSATAAKAVETDVVNTGVRYTNLTCRQDRKQGSLPLDGCVNKVFMQAAVVLM